MLITMSNEKSSIFYKLNEPYAAGLFEEPTQCAFARYSRAVRRYWEHCSLHGYDGGPLYPIGLKIVDDYSVAPDFSFTISVNKDKLVTKNGIAAGWVFEALDKPEMPSGPHTVGGAGYTHSIPNYGRVAREGLDSYAERVGRLPQGGFRDGLTDVISGIRCYHARAARVRRRRPGSG